MMTTIRGYCTATALALAALLALPACGDGGQTPAWLPRYEGPVSGDDGLLNGTLELQERCLYVTGEPDRRTLPIFPSKTSFSPDTGKLVVLGKTFRVGEYFESGGGGVQRLDALQLVARPDPSCLTTDVWIVGDVD